MPVLNWVGKDAVVNHDKEVPFRLLKKVETIGTESENMVIHGDNLEALKALLPQYYGKIKCIYIDPPYNTGNEGWVYNDNTNSPQIKAWLGKTVGAEAEDLCRHDKWLCMMYPRLKLLRELLRDDGVIFISIDYNEVHNLRFLMNEIFGASQFIGDMIWQKKKGGGNDSRHIANEHEYVLVFAKEISSQNEWFGEFTDEYLKRYKFEDENGRFFWDTLARPGLRSPIRYTIIAPDGEKITNDWVVSKKRCDDEIKSGRIRFTKNKGGDWSVQFKQYLGEGKKPRSILEKDLVGVNANAKMEMVSFFNDDKIFSNPKPVALIRYLLDIVSDKNSIILDSFAGSGTTGHAVMQLNKEDSGNRKFILVEMEDYAKTITAERLKRAIAKENYKDGFSYYELSETLLDKQGFINPSCSYDDLGKYLFYAETKSNTTKIQYPIIGETEDAQFYLLFDKRSVLDKAFFKEIKTKPKLKIVYADRCLIEEEQLKENNIIFKQIPYEVKIL